MSSIKDEIEEANGKAVDRMMEAEPYWAGVGLAKDVIPGFKDHMLTHAGPPTTWNRASGPLKGAIIGAAIYEGWTSDEDEVERLVDKGDIVLAPNHEYGIAGPMAGVVSPNMPVIVVEDRKFGNRSYSNLNEGIGKVLRYGAYDEEVLSRLKWIRDDLYPALREISRRLKDGVNLKGIMAQALHMGDECHNRHVAGTVLFMREIAPALFTSGLDEEEIMEVYGFLTKNNFTFLNFAMAAAKAMSMAAHDIKYSTIVSVLTRNGTDAGIWVSGLGDEWFTAPAPVPKGLYFPGYTDEDANPDIGDSAIMETVGLGGFAMAAAPAVVSWVGGTVDYAVEVTKRTYQITYTKNRYFTIPYLSFQGTPTGIDMRKVLKTGITPTINTGIAHKNAGVGQIGAGYVTFPVEMFKKALKRYAEVYGV